MGILFGLGTIYFAVTTELRLNTLTDGHPLRTLDERDDDADQNEVSIPSLMGILFGPLRFSLLVLTLAVVSIPSLMGILFGLGTGYLLG